MVDAFVNVAYNKNNVEYDATFYGMNFITTEYIDGVDGAKEYLKIMSYVSTAIKHGFTSFDAIRRAVMGNSMSIFAQDSE